MAKIQGITDSGFEYEIESSRLTDDWEIVEGICEVMNGSSFGLFKLRSRLLDDKTAQRLNEHCRGKDGKVSTDRMYEEVLSIFKNAGKAGKN